MPDRVLVAAVDAAPDAKRSTATPQSKALARRVQALFGSSRAAIALGLLVLLAVLAVGLHMRAVTKMSQLDEMVHTDYAVQASHGNLVRYGQPVGQVAMQEEACRGIDLATTIPPCGGTLRPDQFGAQLNGFNTAATHPPVYFAITGVLARGLKLVFGIESFVTAARLVGALWLAAGVVLLWFLMGEFRVGPVARAASASLMVIAPVTLNATAFVNNDGSALVCGAGMPLAALLWERRRLPAWAVLVVAAFCALTKATNLLAVGVVVVYLALRAWHRRPARRDLEPRSRRALLGMSAAAAVVAVGCTAVWLKIVTAIAIVPTSYDPYRPLFHVDSLDFSHVFNSVLLGFSPAKDPTTLPPFYLHDGVLTVSTWTNYLLIAGIVGAIVLRRWTSRVGALGIATLVIALSFGPLLIIQNYVTAHEYYLLPPRYGLSLFPVFVVMLAVMADRFLSRAVVVAFATGAVGYTFTRLVAG